MTNRKELILDAALRLFAADGFKGVSTARIAKAAGVSEALIFRHYQNKKGLLDAIKGLLEEKIEVNILPILQIDDAKLIIEKSLDGLLDVPSADYDFWKLQYKLKLNDRYETSRLISPFIHHLEHAFQTLNYPHPKMEAQLLFEIMDTTLKQMTFGELENPKMYIDFLKTKYLL